MIEGLERALAPETALPLDGGALVGRAWMPEVQGPAVISLRGDEVFDISDRAPTMTDLINSSDPLGLAASGGVSIGPIDRILLNSAHHLREPGVPWLLAPVDLQPVKASGVTFAASLLERVIEEQAGGDKTRAEQIRAEVIEIIGSDLSLIEPGSEEAMRLKERLIERGAWSQYLEVGLGPDAEIFTKAPPLSSVGTGARVGVRRDSAWNNPEPELALIVSSEGRIVGASLANDVNLRDIEGRSALLLGKAKDNNASSAIGPLIRLLDDEFDLDVMRNLVISLEVEGRDGFSMSGESSLELISRDLADLADQVLGPDHQYPDGVVLLSGTMFAPTDDRDEPGQGFTHHPGDLVRISSAQLGCLANVVDFADEVEPWVFGLRELMANLATRGLLDR